MSFRLLALLAAGAAALAIAPAALAHQGGKAEPRISAGATGAGLDRIVTVRLTDTDSGGRIRGARVSASAEMTAPHAMRTAPWRLSERRPGTYQARIGFPMPAKWSVLIAVGGNKVVAASASFEVEVARAGLSTGAPTRGLTRLPTRLKDDLTGRDLETMFVLWLHSVAALGWIIGVVVMAIALSTRPGVLAEGFRERLRAGYASWGAWVHWSLVPAIVLTGIYNMLVVTPFPLVWRPSEIKELVDVPYGALYEAILLVKLGLFAALLITGTQTLARSLRPRAALNPARGFLGTLGHALGPAGIAYVVTVPFIVAAAMSLRYVHVLSHVAEVISTSG